MNDSKIVLCVDNNQDSCELIQFILKSEGFQVVSCANSEEGLQLVKENRFSAIVLEYRLAKLSGADFCCRIRAYDKQTPIIFYTTSAYPKDRTAGLAAGANDYLVKPLDFGRIAVAVNHWVSKTRFAPASQF